MTMQELQDVETWYKEADRCSKEMSDLIKDLKKQKNSKSVFAKDFKENTTKNEIINELSE